MVLLESAFRKLVLENGVCVTQLQVNECVQCVEIPVCWLHFSGSSA